LEEGRGFFAKVVKEPKFLIAKLGKFIEKSNARIVFFNACIAFFCFLVEMLGNWGSLTIFAFSSNVALAHCNK